MKAEETQKPIFAILALGLVLYPGFFILDLVMYPSFKTQLLAIRMAVAIIIIFVFIKLKRPGKKNVPLLMWIFLFSCALGISLMCVVVKEGFASPYYAGNLLVVIGSSAFLWFDPRVFSSIITSILVEHFTLLSFLPFQPRDIMKNAFFLGSSAVLTMIIQLTISRFSKRVKVLEGLIPICANCKRIRDDKGYWNQIEQYIREHSEAEFTHGLCPDCIKELYGIDLSEKRNTEN